MHLETSKSEKQQVVGVQLGLLLSMAIWGLNISVVKELTNSFDTTMLAALRMIVAVIMLSGIVLWTRCVVQKVSLTQVCGLGVCAVLMVYLNQLLFAEGLQRSTATNGALIMALSPLVSAVLAAFMFQEKLTLQRVLGVILGFGGVAAVILSHPGAGLSHASVGDLMLVGGVVSFACGGALVQRLSRKLSPVLISWAVYMAGTLMLVAHLGIGSSKVSFDTVFPGWWQWALVLFSGVLATALSNLLWNRAIASIGVARTSVFLYWVPVFGVLFAAMLLDEQLTVWHLVGFLAVMAGTYLGAGHRRTAPVSSS